MSDTNTPPFVKIDNDEIPARLRKEFDLIDRYDREVSKNHDKSSVKKLLPEICLGYSIFWTVAVLIYTHYKLTLESGSISYLLVAIGLASSIGLAIMIAVFLGKDTDDETDDSSTGDTVNTALFLTVLTIVSPVPYTILFYFLRYDREKKERDLRKQLRYDMVVRKAHGLMVIWNDQVDFVDNTITIDPDRNNVALEREQQFCRDMWNKRVRLIAYMNEIAEALSLQDINDDVKFREFKTLIPKEFVSEVSGTVSEFSREVHAPSLEVRLAQKS